MRWKPPFTRFDKAGAAAIGAAVTTVIGTLTSLDPETVAALGILITAGLTWLVPNKE